MVGTQRNFFLSGRRFFAELKERLNSCHVAPIYFVQIIFNEQLLKQLILFVRAPYIEFSHNRCPTPIAIGFRQIAQFQQVKSEGESESLSLTIKELTPQPNTP